MIDPDPPGVAPDHAFLVAADGAWSRAEVRAEVARRRLRLGLRAKGRRVALVADATVDGVLGVLAALDRPRPTVLVHPRTTATERAALASTFSAEGIDAAELAAPGPDSAQGAAPVATDPEAEACDDPERTTVILTTSGTTGRPKGVRLSRRALRAAATASAANLGWAPGDRWLLTIPVAHVGGLSIVTRCAGAGAAVALPRALRRGFRPEAFLEDVQATGTTLVSLVPTMLHRLLDAPGFAWPTSVRAALIGGAAAPPALMAEAYGRGWPVLATYGATETAAQVATQPLGAAPSPRGAVGPPLSGVEVEVRSGRIFVRGPTLFSGYEPDGVGLDADGWFDTRDYGEWEGEWLRVRGRGAEMIVSGGENVFPAEVEAALLRHPDVQAACVVGVPDPEWGEVVGAAVVAAPTLDPQALLAFASRELASFRRPRRVCVLEALPTLPSGKPDRVSVLRALSAVAPAPGAPPARR